jgi:hypothetical protein
MQERRNGLIGTERPRKATNSLLRKPVLRTKFEISNSSNNYSAATFGVNDFDSGV